MIYSKRFEECCIENLNLELWQAMSPLALDQGLIVKEFLSNFMREPSDSDDDFIGISHESESSDSDSEKRSRFPKLKVQILVVS